MWRKWPLVHCFWEYTHATTVKVPQKLKNRTTYDLAIPFLGIKNKGIKTRSQRDNGAPIFTAALFTIAKI